MGMKKTQKLLDELNEEEARLRIKLDLHKSRTLEIERTLSEIADKNAEFERLARARRSATLRRWALRGLLRKIDTAVFPTVHVGAPAHVASIRKIWRTRIKKLARDLKANATMIHPDSCKSGVYALFDENELVYIGQSVNVLSRIGDHVGKKKFSHFSFICVPRDKLDEAERALIDAFLPKYNKDSETVAKRHTMIGRVSA